MKIKNKEARKAIGDYLQKNTYGLESRLLKAEHVILRLYKNDASVQEEIRAAIVSHATKGKKLRFIFDE